MKFKIKETTDKDPNYLWENEFDTLDEAHEEMLSRYNATIGSIGANIVELSNYNKTQAIIKSRFDETYMWNIEEC